MQRVTTYFNLGSSQSGVDFVDVDVDGDVPVYLDPAAIRAQSGDWADAAVESLQTFFKALIDAIRAGDDDRIGALIRPLVEPNETHLGESAGKSQGRSLGSDATADELIESLRSSKAAKSGFLRDLDDTALLVDGIDKDIVSDITTCVIREQLISYTQNQAKFHGIPLESQDSGPIWNASRQEWESRFVDLPRAAGDKLLLVPKSIVRVRLTADKGRYYRGYLRPYFEQRELNSPGSNLVKTLRDKRKKVKLGELDEKLGTTKAAIVENTEVFPTALAEYKDFVDGEALVPLADQEFAEVARTEREPLRDLLNEVLAISPGRPGANSYHRAVAKLLTALFDTQLGNEEIETPLHGGMKRMDITYDNIAGVGFFDWLRKNYPSALVVVECKNYGDDVANPEFDQLAMRFSRDRGQFGMLVCRKLEKPDKARARAKAAAADGHGYVVYLTDDDLEAMVQQIESAPSKAERFAFPLLRERFRELIGVS